MTGICILKTAFLGFSHPASMKLTDAQCWLRVRVLSHASALQISLSHIFYQTPGKPTSTLALEVASALDSEPQNKKGEKTSHHSPLPGNPSPCPLPLCRGLLYSMYCTSISVLISLSTYMLFELELLPGMLQIMLITHRVGLKVAALSCHYFNLLEKRGRPQGGLS